MRFIINPVDWITGRFSSNLIFLNVEYDIISRWFGAMITLKVHGILHPVLLTIVFCSYFNHMSPSMWSCWRSCSRVVQRGMSPGLSAEDSYESVVLRGKLIKLKKTMWQHDQRMNCLLSWDDPRMAYSPPSLPDSPWYSQRSCSLWIPETEM